MSKKDFARETIQQLRKNGVNWPCLKNETKFIDRIERQLGVQQETNLYDFEDIANTILFEVMHKNTILPIGKMIKKILLDHGNLRKPTSPEWQLLPNQSSNDDNTGSEGIDHDMGTVCGPDIGAGSDAHIAIMDIEHVFGCEQRDVFECSMAGATWSDIAQPREDGAEQYDHTRNKIEKTRARLIDWLREKGYTLDTSNRRLGEKGSSEDIKVSFNSSRHQSSRNWELPEVDHRSTTYVARPEVDYAKSFSRECEHNEVQCEGWFGTEITSKSIAKAVTGTPHCLVEGTDQPAEDLMKRYGHRSETWVSRGYSIDYRSTNPDCFRKF